MTQLVKYEAARKALAEAKAVDEVKHIADVASAMKAYARQAKDMQLEIDASEIRIRAERRLGEMLKTQKETVGLNTGAMGIGKSALPKEEGTPTLSSVGIDWKLSSRAQAIATIPEEDFEATLAEHREEQQAVTARTMETLARKGAVHVSHNSGENEWYTPPEYIEAARAVMGGIDCDPASCEQANKTVAATCFFSAEEKGQSQRWHGRVWLNPPYAQPLIRQFAEAVSEKYSSGEIEQAIVLANNATETEWFRTMARQASAICFPAGRIRFLDKAGNPSGAPLQGQAVLYFGVSVAIFKQEFLKFGWLVEICHG